MRAPFTQLYLHLVWATWDRLPLITQENESPLYAVILDQCASLKCTVIAIGGVADHVHLLLRHPPSLSTAEIIKEIKGSSSHFMTHKIMPGEFFKWQGAYGAFSVSKRDVAGIQEYIERQKEHHALNTMNREWEQGVWEG
jgi:REP element-mobilizing transposase RayT